MDGPKWPPKHISKNHIMRQPLGVTEVHTLTQQHTHIMGSHERMGRHTHTGTERDTDRQPHIYTHLRGVSVGYISVNSVTAEQLLAQSSLNNRPNQQTNEQRRRWTI